MTEGLRLTFLGTCGEIEPRTRRHRRHSSLLFVKRGARIMIDCGADWLGRLDKIRPTAILVTHAHPDHAWGLAEGAPCPVYATADTWRRIGSYPILHRRSVRPDRSFTLAGLRCRAMALAHSTRAPAVGFRLADGKRAFFYAPDVVAILDRPGALRGVDLYVGDGATMTRPMVRRSGGSLIGHTTIQAQLGWCRQEGVGRAIFTHCGAEIVRGDGRRMAAKVRQLGRDRGVDARIAHDRLSLTLPLG
jgi:phosphoribosyl 1,2-cyclic phosphodiesterase